MKILFLTGWFLILTSLMFAHNGVATGKRQQSISTEKAVNGIGEATPITKTENENNKAIGAIKDKLNSKTVSKTEKFKLVKGLVKSIKSDVKSYVSINKADSQNKIMKSNSLTGKQFSLLGAAALLLILLGLLIGGGLGAAFWVIGIVAEIVLLILYIIQNI